MSKILSYEEGRFKRALDLLSKEEYNENKLVVWLIEEYLNEPKDMRKVLKVIDGGLKE